MTYEGYIGIEKDEWILMIHEGDGCFTNFFKGEKLSSAKEVKKRIATISEDMGWYEVQYKIEDDDLMVTIFYDTID